MDAAGCDFVGSRKLLKQEVAVFGVLQLKARLISSFFASAPDHDPRGVCNVSSAHVSAM